VEDFYKGKQINLIVATGRAAVTTSSRACWRAISAATLRAIPKS
jgi:hypothetical protein